MQNAPDNMAPRPAHPDGRPRLRVVRDASVSPLSFIRTRTSVDVAFGELLEAYRRHEHATRGSSVSALATLDATLDHLRDFAGIPAAELAVDHVLGLIDSHAYQGLSGSTTRKVLSTLSEIYEYTWTTGARLTNPVRLVPRGEMPSTAPRDRGRAGAEVLTLQQVRRVLDDRTVLRFDERLFFGAALLTGARGGEVAGLQWGDLALDVGPLSGQLRISRGWDCKHHVYSNTKSGEPRLVPVMRQLRELLDEARAWFVARWGRQPLPDEVLCRYMPPRQGGEWRLWSETTALRTWHARLVELGIPHPATGPRRLHATRHTFVSQALRADAQERALEPVTHTAGGARNRGRAFGLYAHLDWSDSCRAVAKLQDALASAG